MPDNHDDIPLDLINMVQQARMQHDQQTDPSDVAAVYWIEVKCAADDCHKPTPRSGQWVLDTRADRVDDQWQIVKKATEAGQLGYKSKVTTAPRSGKSGDSRTIAVRTYDADDEADRQRIHTALVDLGLPDDWRYERDQG